MLHRERIKRATNGEMVDKIPFVPRIDVWHMANSFNGTLPEKNKGRSVYDICRAEGWAIHTQTVDLTYQPAFDAMVHRAIGLYRLKEHVFKYEFSKDIDINIRKSGDRTTIEYHTPLGMVDTTIVYTNEMREGAVSVPHIEKRIISSLEDYPVVSCIFENVEIVPDDELFSAWQDEIGNDGLCTVWFTGAASPMHHIQKYFLDPTQFFLQYNDHQKEMRSLAESLNPLYEKALDIIAQSQAEAVAWGGNFDDMITYPPYFKKEITPWVHKAVSAMEENEKLVYCHCDGENKGLMNLIKDLGIHSAEAVCPFPMTKVPIAEYYKRWGNDLTIFGGIPSNLLIPEVTREEDFISYIECLFESVAPGNRFIIGIADTTPRDADYDRLLMIADIIDEKGKLPLQTGTYRPVTETTTNEARASVSLTEISESLFDEVRDAVLTGQDQDIHSLITDLIDKGIEANDILQSGLIGAMNIIAPKFKSGELFIPEVLLSARVMNKGLEVLEPYLASANVQRVGKILIGTVKGDLHDIGKNMVATMLKGVGFEVVDLGMDVSAETFVEKVSEIRPDILGLSALLTTTMPQMQKVVQEFETQGLRNIVKILIGGAPVTQTFADTIGADGYAPDAAGAVETAKRLLS